MAQRTFHVSLPRPSIEDATDSITVSNFRITTRKLPISKAEPIEEMTGKLGITPPEMIFGDNFVRIEHLSEESPWAIEFNAFDGLDLVGKTGENMLQVAASEKWQANRKKNYSDIEEVAKPFDWSYSTRYLGSTLTTASQPTHLGSAKQESDGSAATRFQPTRSQIPLDKLRRRDPIRFSKEVPLYEDELADNGTSELNVRIRVMPERLLLLSRFFMRLDGVLLRVRDTRVFIEFGTGEVIREYISKEEKYDDARKRMLRMGEDVNSALREPQILAEGMPIIEKVLEGFQLK